MRAEVPTGTVVAGFRVMSQIGEGAMGAVYLAEAPDGARVALKLLEPELAANDRFRQRFLRESEVAASLHHPNIVPTTSSGEDGGRLYLAMAYIEGADLRRILRAERALEPGRALALVAQAADALDAAHAAGLVHRDVKPANILVGEDGHAYVCDFGLARHVSSVSSLTGERGFVGTIDYVSPEQIEGGAIDQRTDVYSLGCVLYECLTGERPFERETELSVVFAHLVEPAPPVTDRRPDLPPGLDEVFARALAKAPGDRFASCGDLVRATEAALEGKPLRRARRRWRGIAAAAAVALAAAVAAVIWMDRSSTRSSGQPTAAVAGNSIAALDPATAGAVRTVALHSPPADLVFGRRAAWVLLADRQRLDRVDPVTAKMTAGIALPFAPGRMAPDADAVWVTEDSGPHVVRIGPSGGRLRVTRRLSVPLGTRLSSPTGIAVGAGSLWLARGPRVDRVDPRTGRVLHRFPTPVTSNYLVFAGGNAWVANGDTGTVFKIDPATNEISHTTLQGWITDLTVAGGSVWVPVVPAGVVYKLSPDDLSVQGQVSAGADPESVSVGGGGLWVANTREGTVQRVDLASGARRTIRMRSAPVAARYRRGLLWIAAAPAPAPLPPVAGGQEIRIPLSRPDIGTLDPAVPANADRLQRDYATCARLLNYPDSAGAAGLALRPEIAAAMPSVSSDGRIYTFRVRSGYRFSPPSGQPVTAQTFRFSLERAFSPTYGSSSAAMGVLGDIVGAGAFNAGHARHISGIRVDGNALSIRLRSPAGDFLTRLAEPFFCPVPIGTPAVAGGSTRPIPSAGPYYIASSAVGRTVLLRNPNYQGPRPRRIERIVYTTGTPTAKAIALIGGGAAEYMDGYTSDADPAALATTSPVARRYGAAAGASRRYFVIPVPGVDAIALNMKRPLFRDVRMRRAVNYVIDRRALAGVYDERPFDRYVPPAVPGSSASHVYPVDGPDLARARRLAGPGRRTAVLYICGPPTGGQIAQILRANLARIGIGLRLDQSQGCLNGPELRKMAAADMALITILDPEFDPSIWVDAPLSGSSYRPDFWRGSALRRRILRAGRLRGAARMAEYSRLEGTLVRQAAPWAAYGAFTTAEYFSPRVGCKRFQGTFHFVDLGALCLR